MVSSPSIWLVFVISISCSFFLPKKKHVCFTVSLLTTRSVSAAPVAKDRKQKNCVILVHVVHAPRVRSICIDRSMSHMLERFIQSLITLNYSALRKISLGERKVINKTPQELLFIFFLFSSFSVNSIPFYSSKWGRDAFTFDSQVSAGCIVCGRRFPIFFVTHWRIMVWKFNPIQTFFFHFPGHAGAF